MRFFVPGVCGNARHVERAYDGMRQQVERELGRAPNSRRISSLWTRRDGIDCVTEVGLPDPLRNGTVIAIFDMGLHQPFVIWLQEHSGDREQKRETLGCNAYSVLEFDP